ncbi:diguanylate cyclase (GGDEF)-like protein [Shimia isoporae]|uniref:diguanylate cyclase n=1 Tax=Shimia isoporae TaxID=647720 RepID=A0A4R1NXX0_9RHOB|nr:diguanylate cyclase [Shimia isoporae]TCL10042.1 diguanylate cyclase (GGDEF)-like protein [Shimia isoporae]
MEFSRSHLKALLFVALVACVAAAPFFVHFLGKSSARNTANDSYEQVLDGEWHFAWGEYLSPAAVLEALAANTLDVVSTPSTWASHLPHDSANPYNHGIATYARELHLPEDKDISLVLHVERIPEAYEVFWVPKGSPDAAIRIASEGNLTGPAKAAYVDLSHPVNGSGKGVLLIHVRKDVLAWGGFFNPPRITTSEIDNVNRKLQRIFDGFWTGCLFFAVFQNFYLFSLRRNDYAPLLLGNAALIVMLHLAASSNSLEVIFGTGVHVLRTRIELLATVTVGPILLLTIRYLIPPLIGPVLMWTIVGFGGFAGIFILAAPADLMSYYLLVYEAFLILVFLVMGYGLGRAMLDGKQGATTLMLALVFILSAAVHDIIAAETGSTQYRITAMAIFVFMALCTLFVGRKVSIAISRSQMLEEEKEMLKKLHSDAVNSARRDHLTGLLNRQAFDHEFTHAWRASNAKVEPLSVVLFDIDHFKQVNDTYGHPMGDRVLKSLADRLADFPMRRHDRVCRYGGEEFALILPNTLLEDALLVAEKIREDVAETPVIDDPEFALSVTCSFGVACTITASGCSAESLLERADEALYAAKDQGRNCVNGVYSLQHPQFPDISAT